MLVQDALNTSQLDRSEAETSRERDRREPELCRLIVAVNVHVRGLVRLVRVKYTRYGPGRKIVGTNQYLTES